MPDGGWVLKRLLSSPKLTVVLLIILAIVSIIGTIIPQDADNSGTNLLFLTDVYHSW